MSATDGTRPEALLSVDDLKVRFATEDGIVRAVDGVSFELKPGEILGIVGESGSGKSVTAQTMMGLTRSPNATIEGSVKFRGKDLVNASDEELQSIRGREIAMVFQDPMTSLNPVYKVGAQIVEAIQAHQDIDDHEAKDRARELLASVGIPNAAKRVDDYPYEFSGGMRQRAMIAMALSLEPRILIADEPTTALDVTIQAQILRLIQQLNQERDLAVILITHDLGVIAEVADRVLVMYAGQIVEQGTLDETFYDPQHPYTWGLMGSLTRLDQPPPDRLPNIAGAPPSLLAPPTGCRFRPRCPHAFEKCPEPPDLEVRLPKATGHADRCWLDPVDKKRLREVEGRIGLEAETNGSPDGARARVPAPRDSEQGEPA
jgi:oligopeptide/dipeptide ABC transporter ATP-binding protein